MNNSLSWSLIRNFQRLLINLYGTSLICSQVSQKNIILTNYFYDYWYWTKVFILLNFIIVTSIISWIINFIIVTSISVEYQNTTDEDSNLYSLTMFFSLLITFYRWQFYFILLECFYLLVYVRCSHLKRTRLRRNICTLFNYFLIYDN